MSFKKDFYWGGSVSSFQTEGAFDEGGKGLSIYDVRETNPEFSDWKVAIDFYHHYKQDIALLKEMGFNFYRFSIAWSRIIPDGEGQINEEGIDFYNRVIDELIANGITPMITFVHFDMPYHLVKKYNGFASRKVVDLFERYVKLCYERFGDRVKHWMTFNEQNLHGLSLKVSNAEVVPVGENEEAFLYQVNHHVFIAHCKAVKALREMCPDGKICGMVTFSLVYPESEDPRANMIASLANDHLNHFHIDVFSKGKYPNYMLQYLRKHDLMPLFEEEDEAILKYAVDYIAFSYYQSSVVKAIDFEGMKIKEILGKAMTKNRYVESTEWGWNIDPLGIRKICRDLYVRTGLPLFILENGMGHREELPENEFIEDDYRIHYHRDHFKQLKLAIEEDGVDLLGYASWGPIDIPSSQCEIAKRYGFVFVNRDEKDLKDLRRVKKKSFNYIKRVYESNGEDLEE